MKAVPDCVKDFDGCFFEMLFMVRFARWGVPLTGTVGQVKPDEIGAAAIGWQ